MSKRPGWIQACLITGVLSILSGCGAPVDDETRIRETIAEMIAALEAGDVGDFMDPVAEDFIAGNGGLDRRAMELLVRRERLARDAIHVRRLDTKVRLIGEGRAAASFRALATGGSGVLPDEARFWQVTTGWRLDDGRWRVISAEWEPALGNL
ncbi:MAG: hypothetical protein RQ847_02330 [Wenzhouxiangellaceae bacterium]|nr:hypothetical protein [Wenzhouxiangellaceae bacterium]